MDLNPPPQLRRGVSKSRPSLANSALLDGVTFESDPIINFVPLTPRRKVDANADPYEQLGSVVGSDDVLIDVPIEVGDIDWGTKRSKSSLRKVPSFPFQGLGAEEVENGDGERQENGPRGEGQGECDGGGDEALGAISPTESSVYPLSTPNEGTGTNASSSGKSSAWSTLSNRLFADVVPDTVTSTARAPSTFTKEYDKLARKHGLQPFPVGHMLEPSSVSVSSVSVKREKEEMAPVPIAHGPIGKGTKILNRLLKRTESTKDLSERSRRTLGHPLGMKRMSVSDLAGMGKSGRKDHLRGLHLEDMVKLSGVCEFNLPEKMSPGTLLVPACFHATGSYILTHGLTSPGIFRVAGNPAATEALYDYYQRQLGTSYGDAIVQTTSLATLPTHLTYTVNDVAHLFKALLAGLPGGLLGSPAVFQALYSIQSFLHPDPRLNPRIARKIRPRMIALAIASLNLHFRITLICAVFGLLRCLALSTHGVIEETKITKTPEAFTYLKEDSLGVIFGPLLLGDKSDQILLPCYEERGGLLVLPTVAPRPEEEPTKGKYKQKKNQGYVQLQREKARRAALVTEMIITEWENVVVEMKKIGALEVTRTVYDIPGLESEGDLEVGGAAPQIQQRSSSRGTTEGKLRKAKSVKKPSRDISRTEEGADGTKMPLTEPTDRRHHHLHLPNSQSAKHMRENLHRAKSKAGDLLHFPIKSHSRHFSEAANMNTALLPINLIGEQDLDLMDTAEPAIKSGGLEESSSLNMGTIFEEAAVQSLPGPSPVVAQEMSREVQEPVLLMELGGRIEESGGVGLDSTEEINLYEKFQNSNNYNRGYSKPVPDDAVATPPVNEEELGETGLAKMQPENRVTTLAQNDMSLASPSPAPRFMLTTPGGRGVDIRMQSERGQAHTRESGEITDMPDELPSIPTTYEVEEWHTPPLEITSPNLGAPQLTVLSEEDEREEQEQQEEISKEDTQGADFEDRYSFTSSPELPSITAAPATPIIRATEREFSETPVSSSHPYSSLAVRVTSPSPSVLPLEMRSNSALYSEIRRLRALLDKKTEEAERIARELEMARGLVSAESVGAMGQLLRDAREEMKVWRNRAEWAERRVREMLVGDGQRVGRGLGEVGEERGGYANGNEQLDGHGHASEVDSWSRSIGVARATELSITRGRDSMVSSRGRGRGRMVGGSVAQRVGSWGVGLEELGRGRGDRGSEVVTVGPHGPLRPPEMQGGRGRGRHGTFG